MGYVFGHLQAKLGHQNKDILKSRWLKRVKVYFLLMSHPDVVGDGEGLCYTQLFKDLAPSILGNHQPNRRPSRL